MYYMRRRASSHSQPMIEVEWPHEGAGDDLDASQEERPVMHVDLQQRTTAARLNVYQDITVRELTLTGYVSTGVVDHLRRWPMSA
jgi:hypothetical protein